MLSPKISLSFTWKSSESCDLNRYSWNVEPVFNLAEADEKQGVDDAQELCVHKVLKASSTRATKPVAASVESKDRLSYGPDRSGTYGEAQGIGGLESTYLENAPTSQFWINNFFGDTLARIFHTE